MDQGVFMKTVDAVAGGGQARNARQPIQHALTSVQNKPLAGPDDLVERALAILGEGTMMSGEAQSTKRTDTVSETKPSAPESSPSSTDLKLQRLVLSDGTE